MLIPTCLWAQRKDKLFITIDLQDVEEAKTDLKNVDGVGKLTFRSRSGGDPYGLDLALYQEIDVAASRVSICPRRVFLVIAKTPKSSGHWTRLTKEPGRHITHIKCDWHKWVDEDEEDGSPEKVDMSKYSFSSFEDDD